MKTDKHNIHYGKFLKRRHGHMPQPRRFKTVCGKVISNTQWSYFLEQCSVQASKVTCKTCMKQPEYLKKLKEETIKRLFGKGSD